MTVARSKSFICSITSTSTRPSRKRTLAASLATVCRASRQQCRLAFWLMVSDAKCVTACQRLAFHSYDGPMDRRLSPRKISFTNGEYRKPGKPGTISAGCHVGSPADDEHLLRDVNHDLIAAGHPRLDFSFSAYLNLMPKHWPDGPRRKDSRPAHYGFRPDSETHAETWAIGQAVTAQAALELLASRAGSDEKLANGAEERASRTGPMAGILGYDCYACHHQLDNSFPSSRQKAAQRRAGTDQLGSLRWGTWCFPEVRLLIGSQPFAHGPKTSASPWQI